MAHKIISVTYEIDAQNHKDGQFSVPKKICEFLELNSEDNVALEIISSKGALSTQSKLASGYEIYGQNISNHVSAGEKITVTVSTV